MKGKQHDGIKHTAKIMTAMELYPHIFFLSIIGLINHLGNCQNNKLRCAGAWN